MSQPGPGPSDSKSSNSGQPGSGQPGSGSANATAAPRLIPFFYHLVVNATRLPLILRGQRVLAHGLDLIPATGRLVIAGGNHTSNMDPFIIAQTLPAGRRVQFLAKKELFKGPVGWLISAGGSFPIDRSRNDLGAIRSALRVLLAEGTLGIFPEGTRGGQELQGGTALLALKGKAPITPVWLKLEGKTWIARFGAPIEPKGSVKELTERIGAALDDLGQVG